jgi:hypothetical protein
MRSMNRRAALVWLRRIAAAALCIVMIVATWTISQMQFGSSGKDLLTGRWRLTRQGETAPLGYLEISATGQVTCFDLHGARNMAPGYSERWERHGNSIVAMSTHPGAAGNRNSKLLSRVKDSASRWLFPTQPAPQDSTQHYLLTVKSDRVLQLDLIRSPTTVSCTLERVMSGSDQAD